jgi:hypothetical protein
MCIPLVAAAATVAGTAMSAVSAAQQGKAQDALSKSSAATSQANADAAYDNYVAQMQALKIRMQQTQFEAIDMEQSRKMSAEQLSARIMVSAGEAGVTGNSIKRLRNMPKVAAGQDIITIERNLRSQMQQLYLEGVGLQAQAKTGQISAQSSTIAPNNWAATSLQIGGTIMQGVSSTASSYLSVIGK